MSFLDSLPKPFLALAPMDDVTDSVFRQIVADCAPPDLYYTEFVNVDGLQSPGRPKLLKKLQFTDKEKPIFAQLWGLNPENFYKTVKQIVNGTLVAEANYYNSRDSSLSKALGSKEERTSRMGNTLSEPRTQLTPRFAKSSSGVGGSADKQADAAGVSGGFDGVDLNMGCPVKAVIKNGACAALINNRELADEIIDATRKAARKNFPISVKTRVGFTTPDMSWLEFLLTKKLDLLSIHGRTAKQLSNVPANWDLIGKTREMRDSLSLASAEATAGRPTTLIVGNGDVMSRQEGLELAKKYKLDGIMIGRGVFHDPFVFANPPAGGSPWGGWSKEQKLGLFKKHIELFAKTWQHGEYKFEVLKKFAKVYANGFEGASELRFKFMMSQTLDEALLIIDKI